MSDGLMLGGKVVDCQAGKLDESLRYVLEELVPTGDISLAVAARRLYVSPRSLQRYLSVSGTTFSREVKEVRLELAVSCLRKGKQSTDEISELVGYQDTVSFRRAFRKWTGMTVDEYRRFLNAASPSLSAPSCHAHLSAADAS